MQIKAKHYATGRNVVIEIQGQRIQSIEETPEDTPYWVAPALSDIQINGFGGRSFNGDEVSSEAAGEIVRQQWELGVGSLCPTVVTNSHERMLASVRAIRQACADEQIASAILGIHIEGPYISPVDGPRGAHPKEHVRPPNWDEFQELQDEAGGRICLFTLAPEVEGAIPFIERLSGSGVVVGLGHTDAEADDIDAAIQAGARLSTHLGNGAHALIHRHPNYIWEQLARDELRASLIVDGHHLPPAVVKCMLRAKGVERTILVSDAVSFAGMAAGTYPRQGHDIEVSPDGRVSLAGTPYLAGAGLDLPRCVGNLVRFTEADLATAIRMATHNPAQLLGRRELGVLEAGKRADMMLFEWRENAIQVHQTIVNGQAVFSGQ